MYNHVWLVTSGRGPGGLPDIKASQLLGCDMKLTLISIDKSGVIHIAAEGDITSRDFGDAVKNPMELVLGHNWATNSVLFDLTKTSFIDSSAVGWLIDCQRRFKERGGKLVLHSPTARVRDVIDLLKMRQVLNVQDNAASAAAQLNVKEGSHSQELP